MQHRKAFKVKFTLCHCLRKRREKKLFESGIDRAMKELDVERFIKTQMKVRMTFNVLFTKLEKLLLQNQQCFVLNSEKIKQDSSDQSSFDIEDYKLSNLQRGNPHLIALLNGIQK